VIEIIHKKLIVQGKKWLYYGKKTLVNINLNDLRYLLHPSL